MDPHAAWKELLEARYLKDWDRAEELAKGLRFRSPSLLSQRVPNAHESPCFQGLSFLPRLENALLNRSERALVGGTEGQFS